MTWYYHLNGENQGPVDAAELQRLRQTGAIADDTPVWEQGMPQWASYGTSTAATSPAAAVAPLVETQTCVECGQRFPQADMLNYEGSWVCAACKPIFFQRVKEAATLPGVYKLASIGKRFVAVFVDGILIYIVVGIPATIATVMLAATHEQHILWTILLQLVQIGVPAFYEIFFIGKFGATLGKMLMKVKVVRASGTPLTYGRATGRYFAKALSGLILMIGYLMAFWDDQKRALHDRICDTRVIDSSAA